MASTALVAHHPGSIRKVFSKYMHLKGKVDSLKEKGEELVEGVVTTTETVGSSFIFGAAQGAMYGRKDKAGKVINDDVLGVPLPLLAGVGLHLGAVLGFAGKHGGNHLRNFGNGALCALVSNLGRGVGYRWKTKTDALPKTSGSLKDDVAALLNS